MNPDEDHLRLLSIFHYIVAGMVAFFSLFPVIHLVLGIMTLANPGFFGPGEPPPPFVGWLFIVLGLGFILCGETIAILIFLIGRFLTLRKHYMFCTVMAGIECLIMPLGTILGVFTIIVLMREPVKAMFHHQPGVQPAS